MATDLAKIDTIVLQVFSNHIRLVTKELLFVTKAVEEFTKKLGFTKKADSGDQELQSKRPDFEKKYVDVVKSDEAAKMEQIQNEADGWRKVAGTIKDVADQEKMLTKIAKMEAQQRLEASTTWQAGAERAWNAYYDKAMNVGKTVEDFMTRSLSSVENSLVQFVTTGKMNFSDLANSILNDLIKTTIHQGVSMAMSGVGSGITSLLGLIFSANGNVFSSGALSRYSSTIVDQPTFFPFAKGIGLMGEAGAEAIMPLGRDTQGRLGVRIAGQDSSAGGGGQSPAMVFENHTHLHASGGTPEQNEDLVARAGKAMNRQLRGIVNEELVRHFRSGGYFSPAVGRL